MNPCPRCQIPLEMVEIDGEKALMCRQCEGLMLRKLDHLLGLSEQQLMASEASETLFADHPQVDVSAVVACPICNQAMRRYIYSTDSGVTVDACQSGHGIWLDDGELAKIYDYVNGKGGR